MEGASATSKTTSLRREARLTATKLLQLEGTSAYPATHRPLARHPGAKFVCNVASGDPFCWAIAL
jgi:hypothetical protein